MIRNSRPRQLITLGLAAVLGLTLAACAPSQYPNTTFEHSTEFNTLIDSLWDRMMFWGTIVFVVVEALLIYVMIRFRRLPNSPEPQHVHGNTVMEISWTLIPAVILVFIAIPTVRTIFRTQAKAVANALQVEVIGHQWWWEFRYPQYGIITANELYLPIGRTVNFSLRSADVIHSFWIPRLGGKRDVVSNHTNYLWFTIDSTFDAQALNGSCNEYCGASHANMRFRTLAVSEADFESWAAHERLGATGAAPATAPSGTPAAGQTVPPGGAATAAAPATATGSVQTPAATAAGAPLPGAAQATAIPAGYIFPREKVAEYVIPDTPVPPGLDFPANLTGDVARGRDLVTNPAKLGKAPCATCHVIKGAAQLIPDDMAKGPNLTHVGSRLTIGAGLFPNDDAHLARWIKNARAMKPGVTMPTLGKGQIDPITKQPVAGGAGLTDQEIADIVAYLRSLR